MLISFSMRNFRSFADENPLEMMPGRSRNKTDHINKDCLRIAAIYGNNASGKSNLVTGLHTLKSLVTDPYYCDSRPLTNWDSDEDTIRGRVTSFRIEFRVGMNVYKYELGVTSEKIEGTESCPSRFLYTYPVQYERLSFYDAKYEPYSDGTVSETIVFEYDPKKILAYLESNTLKSRSWKYKDKCNVGDLLRKRTQLIHRLETCNTANYTYSIKMQKKSGASAEEIDWLIHTREKNDRRRSKLRKEIKENAFRLGCSQLKHIPNLLRLQRDRKINGKIKSACCKAMMREAYDWFMSNLIILNTSDIYLQEDDDTLDSLSSIISGMDLGIEKLEWKVVKKKTGRNSVKTIEDSIGTKDRIILDSLERNSDNAKNKSYIVKTRDGIFRFSYMNGKKSVDQLVPIHSDYSIRDLYTESDGTVRMIELSSILIPTENEITFVVDELDRRLHPMLTRRIIESFLAEGKGSKQLIFTTHETEILTTDLFRKDEIWFVQKDKKSSYLCSLDEISGINYNKRLERLYLEDKVLPGIPRERKHP